MGSYTSPSGGGGGAIYESGEPFTVTLNVNETTTVPTGQTWVTNLTGIAETSYQIDGVDMSDITNRQISAKAVLKEGTTVTMLSGSNGSSTMLLSGWKL